MPFDIKIYLPYIQSAGIILSFLLSAYTFFRSTRANKLTNYVSVVKSHREIWLLYLKEDGFDKVLSSNKEDWTRPITSKEQMFITFLINHLSCSYELMKSNQTITSEGLKRDIRQFFARPIPRRVWEETKLYRNSDFVAFVDRCLVFVSHFTASASGKK